MNRRVLLFGIVTLSMTSVAWSEENPEAKAIDQAIAAYTKAYNAADITALAAHWAPDCDFVDHRGRRYSGRDEITALFRKALVDGRGYQIKMTVSARRFLKPDLAMDDGVLELTEPSGEKETGRYVTLWTKSDGKWLVQSVRDMPSDPEKKASGQNPLNDLQFLVGEWTQEGASGEVTVYCDWKVPGKFLVQNFKAKSNETTYDAVVWIGWDPVERKIRSWYFDSTGGFGEATWQQRGNAWRAATFGILADGQTSTSTAEWIPAEGNALVWKSIGVEVEGQPVADTEVKYSRKK
ncbi:MAG: SgcJ/EcaC family oxidoreductase [Planctomycetaceae bacterium]